MNIVGIVGSPRRDGNTNTLIEKILHTAEENEHNINLHHINSLDINPCQGCYYCKKNDGCDLDDDMVEIYNELYDSDIIIIGSPIYFGEVSAQTKIFTDRLYSIFNNQNNEFKDKKIILVYVQASPDQGLYKNYIENQRKYLYEYLGFEIIDTLHVFGILEKENLLENKEFLKNAEIIGSKL
jgi:multimeric flavodoxin WrbA